MNQVFDSAGNLISEWDEASRTVTEWENGEATTRPFTDAENAVADLREKHRLEADNEHSIREKLSIALAGNTAYLNTTTPTAAQTTAQVKALTRQMTALIRLTTRQLDSDN